MTKTITFTFSDPIFTRMVKALSNYFGWTATIPDGLGGTIPNPVSRKDFLITNLRRWLLDIARDSEINDTMGAAVISSNAALDVQRAAAKVTAAELDVTITNGT